MLATLEGPIRIQLHTLINIRGTNHSQFAHIQLNPHIRSILGRTYHQLFLTPGTLELAPHIAISTYNPTKGITGRRTDKLLWATILLHNVDTLEVFEEAIRQAGEAANAATATNPSQDRHDMPPTMTPPADLHSAGAQNTGNTRGRGGGRGARPSPGPCKGPTKTRTRTTNGAGSNNTQGGRSCP
jgi:hypothetical protein